MKYLHILIIVCLSVAFTISSHASEIENMLVGAYREIDNETKYNTQMPKKYFPPTYKNGKNTGKPVYPGGDVNPEEGICADLVVRALRNAGVDLQELVHLDILPNKEMYGVNIPDKYIDQRRVWILKTYFKRKWKSLPKKLTSSADWQPGDVVIWDIGSKEHLHIGIVGKKKRRDGFPYVIHNMRYVPFLFAGKTVEQDILEGPEILWISVGNWKIIGHYRMR